MGQSWVPVRDGARQGTLRAADKEVRAERWEQFVDYLALGLSQDLGRDVEPVRSRKQTLLDVMLLAELHALLLRHRMRSLRKAATDYVFSSPTGRPRDHRSTSRGIERAVRRAKLGDGISAHNFRHTYASHLIIGLKEDAVTVAGQLGHTKASYTQDFYSREFDKVRMDDERRKRYSAGYGHLLNAVNTVETGA